MDIPQTTQTPAIRIHGHHSQHHLHHHHQPHHHHHPHVDRLRPSRSSLPYASPPHQPRSSPMSIPNARDLDVPPPLPPPRHIEELANGSDPGWQWGNSRNGGQFGVPSPRQANSLSSLFAGQARRDDPPSRGHDPGSRPDETSSSLTLGPRQTTNPRLQGEKPLEDRNFQHSLHEYDKSILSKIDSAGSNPLNSSHNFRPPPLSRSANSAGFGLGAAFDRRPSVQSQGPWKSDGRANSVDTSFAKWQTGLHSAAVSPRHVLSGQTPADIIKARTNSAADAMSGSSPLSQPSGATHMYETGLRRPDVGMSRHYDEPTFGLSRSQRSSYDQGFYAEADTDFPMDETGMRHLHLEDRTPPDAEGSSPGSKPSKKRRASSPPREITHEVSREDRLSLGSLTSNIDWFRRRSSGLASNRLSPVPRLNHGSVSSVASSAPRTGSYASSAGLSLAASSMTSYSTFDRLSPGLMSPTMEHDMGQDTPFTASTPLSHSPRSSVSQIHHQRALSETTGCGGSRTFSADVSANGHQQLVSKVTGVYICECCPKKPKKFDTQEELQTHAMEKQYTCAYCPNRFKNKNEAERHQNSLHLRRHSWSCAALSGVQAAFHSSANHPGSTDVCGYCGEEFPKPANWDARVEHLNGIHKFGECNQAKKFFRADHFRQHLKHSHAGTSGKWTNMLENACMQDEPLPDGPGNGSSERGNGSVSGVSGAGVTTIDESHEES